MSKMSDLFTEIQELIEDGRHPGAIAMMLDVPTSMVYEVLDEMQTFDQSPVGDFPSEEEIDRMANYYMAKEESCEFD